MINKIAKALVVILGIIAGVYSCQHSKLKKENATNESILAEKQAELKSYISENGRLRQEKQAAIIEASEANKAAENYKEEVQDIEDNHEVELKRVHSYYSSRIIAKGSGSVPARDTTIYRKDTTILSYPYFSVNDGYLWLSAVNIGGEYEYGYTYQDKFSIVAYWTQKGFWPFKSNDKLMVSFSNENPSSYFEETRSIVFKEGTKKDRWSIGPCIGAGVTSDLNPIGFVGVSLQYSIWKF